jgi:hypothetical protein
MEEAGFHANAIWHFKGFLIDRDPVGQQRIVNGF